MGISSIRSTLGQSTLRVVGILSILESMPWTAGRLHWQFSRMSILTGRRRRWQRRMNPSLHRRLQLQLDQQLQLQLVTPNQPRPLLKMAHLPTREAELKFEDTIFAISFHVQHHQSLMRDDTQTVLHFSPHEDWALE